MDAPAPKSSTLWTPTRPFCVASTPAVAVQPLSHSLPHWLPCRPPLHAHPHPIPIHACHPQLVIHLYQCQHPISPFTAARSAQQRTQAETTVLNHAFSPTTLFSLFCLDHLFFSISACASWNSHLNNFNTQLLPPLSPQPTAHEASCLCGHAATELTIKGPVRVFKLFSESQVTTRENLVSPTPPLYSSASR